MIQLDGFRPCFVAAVWSVQFVVPRLLVMQSGCLLCLLTEKDGSRSYSLICEFLAVRQTVRSARAVLGAFELHQN